MPKVNLNTLTSGYQSNSMLNDNFTIIEDAFDNTLSLDGSTPNALQADIDMNSHKIINLADPVNGQDAIPKSYADTNYGAAAAASAAASASAASTSASTASTAASTATSAASSASTSATSAAASASAALAAVGGVKVTTNDTTATVLDTALLVGSTLTKTVNNPSADETLTLNVATSGITATQLATDAVTTAKLQNNAVTLAKLATQAANTILMNATASTAVPTATSFAANTFPGRSSTGDLAAKPITDFGFSLLDDASASVARTTLGFEKFVSTNQTVPAAAGLLTVAHGLTGKPDFVQLWAECTTAEAGYSIGDQVIVIDGFTSGGSSLAQQIYIDDTSNIEIRMSASFGLIIGHKTTGTGTVVTAANWRFIVKAWKF